MHYVIMIVCNKSKRHLAALSNVKAAGLTLIEHGKPVPILVCMLYADWYAWSYHPLAVHCDMLVSVRCLLSTT